MPKSPPPVLRTGPSPRLGLLAGLVAALLAAAPTALAEELPLEDDDLEAAPAALEPVLERPDRALEPWSDPDPGVEPRRWEMGDFGFRTGAEYRMQALTVRPVDLASETNRNLSWLEHRLRLDATVDYLDKVKIAISADVLDGVLWGDNGTFGGSPSSNSGANINARNPNFGAACITHLEGDPLDRNAYGYGLCEQDPIRIRKLYGEVALPFGALRIGRQSVNLGTTVQAADGDGRPNRFGASRTGNVVDRILFATKPLEALKPKSQRDTSAHRGAILALAYDRFVTDDVHLRADDVHQYATALRYLAPKHALGRDLLLAAYHAHRWDRQYDSTINSIGGRAMSRFGDFHAGIDFAMNLGSTREIAEAYGIITNDPPVAQDIRQFGARAVVRYDRPLFSLYLEADYASGDEDPSIDTPLTQFVFAEDANIGLLMFKHTLAYQTGRSSAAAVETLRRLGATTFPAEAIATRGAFTNAFAIFPQVDLRPLKTLLVRGGVLMAWAPSRVVDPVGSLQARDGVTIEDDLVNFVGGRPGSYYGTELDLRISWRYVEHFIFDLEGALLFPGDAFQDRDGYAARSGLVQARTTFFF